MLDGCFMALQLAFTPLVLDDKLGLVRVPVGCGSGNVRGSVGGVDAEVGGATNGLHGL